MLMLFSSPGTRNLYGSLLGNRLNCSRPKPVSFEHSKTIHIRAKLKVDIIRIGKKSGKDAIYDSLVSEYAKRLSRVISIHEKYAKCEAAPILVRDLAQRESIMLMDENGTMPRDSVHFSEMVFAALELGGSRLSIVIGDADGLPNNVLAIKSPRIQKVSLSPLTFTHKMVRLFIYEQLYRAAEIRKNNSGVGGVTGVVGTCWFCLAGIGLASIFSFSVSSPGSSRVSFESSCKSPIGVEITGENETALFGRGLRMSSENCFVWLGFSLNRLVAEQS
ncbi:unnamed protein product [Agarophyton chilense]